jgi:hypothetical protein
MSEFEECTRLAGEEMRAGNANSAVVLLVHALEALAAERAAERKAKTAKALDELALIDAPLICGETETPYTRAMTAPRQGGQHPHDGRHIMSIGSWGMW